MSDQNISQARQAEAKSAAIAEDFQKNDKIINDKVASTDTNAEVSEKIVSNPVDDVHSAGDLMVAIANNAEQVEAVIDKAAGDTKHKSVKSAFKRWFTRAVKKNAQNEVPKTEANAQNDEVTIDDFEASNTADNVLEQKDDEMKEGSFKPFTKADFIKERNKRLENVGRIHLRMGGTSAEAADTNAILSGEATTSAASINRTSNIKTSLAGYWKSLFGKGDNKPKRRAMVIEFDGIEDEGASISDLNTNEEGSLTSLAEVNQEAHGDETETFDGDIADALKRNVDQLPTPDSSKAEVEEKVENVNKSQE